MLRIRPSCGDEKNDTVLPDVRREREREKGEQIGMSGSGGEQRELLVWKGGMGGEGVVEGRVVEGGGLVEGRGMVGVVLLMVVVVVLVMGLGVGVLGWRCWVKRRKRRAGRRMMLRPWDERVEEGVLLDDMFRD
jgi:hypothetical protein